jgi:long-chain acyl-CoA synthetase
MKLIGIFARNREEWTLLDMANCLYGFTMVPLYENLGNQGLTYVLANSDIKTCFCSKLALINLIKTQNLHNLKTIISLDPLEEDFVKEITQKGLQLRYFSDFVA